jgi:3-isopropylmalate/(R)-2-methylmalate dehydratase small subunit
MKPFRTHKGKVAPLDRANIDTDQIIPKQFLKRIERTGFGEFLFYDWRRGKDGSHDPSFSLNHPRYAGASVLVTGKNFGCGSSREHAPQGLARAGFRAIVGESFSEIFLGNAAMLGVPCFVADGEAIDRLQTLVEATPEVIISADVASGAVTAGSLRLNAAVSPALRDGFVSGQWNPTAMLLDRFEEVRAVAARLPYIRGF